MFQQCFEFLVIGEGLRDAFLELLGNVVLLGFSIGITDGQIVLGAMPGAIFTLASRLSAAYVALDERATEDVGIDGSDLLEEGVSSCA